MCSSLSVQPLPGAFASEADAVAMLVSDSVSMSALEHHGWLVLHDPACTFGEADDDACSCSPRVVRLMGGISD